jgi:Uncharacterized protein conserved in bacteria
VLTSIKSFFSNELFNTEKGSTADSSEHQLQLACAALLIEVAVIDQEFDTRELQALTTILQTKFNLSAEECETLRTLAQSESEDSTSMYQFTQLVNSACSPEQKFELIKGMWTIAYADGDLDKYEEYIVRKVSELIYVSHSEFIRAKLAARP